MTMDVPFAGVPTIYKNLIFVGMNLFGPGRGAPALSGRSGRRSAGRFAGPTMRAPARSFGSFTPSRVPANPIMTTGRAIAGKAAPAITCGLTQCPWMSSAALSTCRWAGPRPTTTAATARARIFTPTQWLRWTRTTGKLKWYFQTVHHELWDYDLPPDPALIDIVKDGKKIPALAQAGKSGYLFILDRVTGKPVFGVEERPVAQGNVPDESYSPTQPFPVKPPPLARVSIKREDIVTADDTNADHAKACQDLWVKHGFEDSGPFTPWAYSAEGTPAHETISFPGPTGGTNWGGVATDQKLGYVFRELAGQPRHRLDPQESRCRERRPASLRQSARATSAFAVERRTSPCCQTAMGAPVRRERQHGRHRVAGPAGHYGRSAARQAEHRTLRSLRRTHRYCRADWSSSAPPATAASARSIRKPAKNSGPPSSTTPPPPCRSLIRAKTASSTLPSSRPAEAAAMISRWSYSPCLSSLARWTCRVRKSLPSP